MNLNSEIAALHRIGGYQHESLCWSNWGPGMFSLDDYFTIEIDGGELKAVIDFYSPNLPDGQDFDVDAWDAEKLELHMKPVSRKGFAALYRIVRSLLTGVTVTFQEGTLGHRQNCLDSVCNMGLGFDVSFEDRFIQIEVRP
jgi:hypothetical protein